MANQTIPQLPTLPSLSGNEQVPVVQVSGGVAGPTVSVTTAQIAALAVSSGATGPTGPTGPSGIGSVTMTSPAGTMNIGGSPGSLFTIDASNLILGAENVLAGVYMYATLPSPLTYPNMFASTLDQGAVFSSGGAWQILYNQVSGTLKISTGTPLTPATQNVAYSLQFTSSNGTGTVTWILVADIATTNAWTISTSGLLTGTPTAVETDTLIVQATDSTGAVSQKAVSIATVASQSPAATPTFSPAAGTYATAQTVTISDSTPSATIYYTTNGATPSTSSPVYTAPLTVSATATIKAIATAPGFTQSAVGSATYTISANLYQGTNISVLQTAPTEQPFLNIAKISSSNNTNFTAWASSGSTTAQQIIAVVDSNGYMTSLPGGNKVTQFMNASMNDQDPLGTTGSGIGNGLPPGASVLYPSGSYTLTFQGACTLVLASDAVSGSLATSSANVSVSGLTITSTMTSTQTGVVTFNVTPSVGGILLNITALPSSTNYFRNHSVVRTSQVANYAAGQLFDPNWIASITNNGAGGFQRIRYMNALQMVASTSTTTPGQVYAFQLPALTTSSSTTQTMVTGAWPNASGVYQCVLGNAGSLDTAQNNTVTLTNGSSTAVFGSAFTQSVTAGGSNMWIQSFSGWSTRNQQGFAFWVASNGNGTPPMLPYEVCLAMSAATNTDCWLNVPIWANNFTPNGTAFWTGLANACLADYTANPGRKYWIELANEVFIESDEPYANMLAKTQLGVADFVSWMGYQLALISQTFQTVFGSSFSTAVRIGPSTEFSTGNGVGFLEAMMNGPSINGGVYPNSFLAAPPYTYFTHWSVAPYMPPSNVSFPCSVTNGNPVMSAPNNFISGSPVLFSFSAGGFSGGTTYYVLPTNLSATQFEVSATVGGSAITPTANVNFSVSPSAAADLVTMMGVTTPLDDFFACMYGNVGTVANGSNVYRSLGAYVSTSVGLIPGMVSATVAAISAMKSAISSQVWNTYPVHGYEGGPNFGSSGYSSTAGSYTGPYGGGSYTTLRSAITALFLNAQRDPRMGYALYDPTAQLSSNPGFLVAATSAGMTSMNYFDDCQFMSSFGPWGALENVMQLPAAGGSGTATSYPKYAALMNWIEGIT
jgi:Chitobiase/beta-hexosaminidase C-terminal domain